MVKRDHLNLPVTGKIYQRRLHGGGRHDEKKGIEKFAKTQINKLNKLSNDYKQTRVEFPNYSQELFFKMKTMKKVNETEFRSRLRNSGCKTISTVSEKQFEWIIASDDVGMEKLKNAIKNRLIKRNANFIDDISGFEAIKFNDKVGNILRQTPMSSDERANLVFSLIRPEFDDVKLDSALSLISDLAKKHDMKLYDTLITDNVCLVLLECTKTFAEKLSGIDLVEKIDRMPNIFLERLTASGLKGLGNSGVPPVGNHGILVMDSGIVLHPLLDDSVDKNNGMVGLPNRIQNDDRVHGTAVSGIALYGDIKNCLSKKHFSSEIWIYSAKIFYEKNGKVINRSNEKTLFEKRLSSSIEKIKSKFPKCKVVNISFGYKDELVVPDIKQHTLAALIDDLAIKYDDVIFVISIGNLDSSSSEQYIYPKYLVSKNNHANILNPASSVHAFAVGAVCDFDNKFDQPSNITRLGPGLNGMIKPDFVESGGGFGDGVIVLNRDFSNKLFRVGAGTSYSAPKIAHYLAKLYNHFPNYGRNMIMALLMSSANMPVDRPSVFPKIDSSISGNEFQKLANVYGFGKPSLDDALFSGDDRVVFKFEGTIEPDRVKYFTIKLPDEVIAERHVLDIGISLVFDPPVRKTRADYLGSKMEFHLFKNIHLDKVMNKYNSTNPNTSDELTKFEIKLKPSNNIRKKSNHQKGTIMITNRSHIDNRHPLILVVMSQKKWVDDGYKQNFAVVLTIKHNQPIDLYNKLQAINQVRTRVEF